MSTRDAKTILSLQVSDLEVHPVWEFTNNDAGDDCEIRPIRRLPVSTLRGRVIGSLVRLANGDSVWAVIGNLDTRNAKLNEHFVTLSIERNGNWFALARYFDPQYRSLGPSALARFLQFSVNEVFPISYDVRAHVKGDPAALRGTVLRKPKIRLTREKLIALAVP